MPLHDKSQYSATQPHRGPLSARAALVGLALLAVCAVVTGTLAVYFVAQDSLLWSEMNGYLLLGTLATAVGVFVHAWMTFSFKSAGSLFVVSCVVGFTAEFVGLQGGVLFGAPYEYHQDLSPCIAGVPLFIPLAWFVLTYAPLVFLRWVTPSRGSSQVLPGWLSKAILCALGLTATDLYLDPLATSVAAWTWLETGAYFGVPFGNYLGWFMVGLTIYTCHFAFARPHTSAAVKHVFVFDCLFVGASVLLTLAAWIALSKHLDSVLPAAIAASAVVPFWVSWWRGTSAARSETRR